jgi:hypothetical protein
VARAREARFFPVGFSMRLGKESPPPDLPFDGCLSIRSCNIIEGNSIERRTVSEQSYRRHIDVS